jgi:5-methyltetrahydropteroyltriglutamate--homocysteine methyltransferase
MTARRDVEAMTIASPIPTTVVGSLPRPLELIEASKAYQEDRSPATHRRLGAAIETTLAENLRRQVATAGLNEISDGEPWKRYGFALYPVQDAEEYFRFEEGVPISFEDGHTRRLPLLVKKPALRESSVEHFKDAKPLAQDRPLKAAIISPSALGLAYQKDVPAYPKDSFVQDVLTYLETDARNLLEAGASHVQVDVTEAPIFFQLAGKEGVRQVIDLNNELLARLPRDKTQVHVCFGSDVRAEHSKSVGYKELWPALADLKTDGLVFQFAGRREGDLDLLDGSILSKNTRIYVGAIDVSNTTPESPNAVAAIAQRAARRLGVEHLGLTTNCGFSPFGDDPSMPREIAFAKLAALGGGALSASAALGLS